MNECNVLHAVLAGDLSPCRGPNAAVSRDPCSWLCSAWADRPAAAASRSESSPTALWAIRGRREGSNAKKPFVSHLCSELGSTLLTELLGRYAFGHSQPHRRHLKLHPTDIHIPEWDLWESPDLLSRCLPLLDQGAPASVFCSQREHTLSQSLISWPLSGIQTIISDSLKDSWRVFTDKR